MYLDVSSLGKSWGDTLSSTGIVIDVLWTYGGMTIITLYYMTFVIRKGEGFKI